MIEYTSIRYLKSINDEKFVINYTKNRDEQGERRSVLYRYDRKVFRVARGISHIEVLKQIENGYVPEKDLIGWEEEWHDGRANIDDSDMKAIMGIIKTLDEYDRKILPLWFKEIIILWELQNE